MRTLGAAEGFRKHFEDHVQDLEARGLSRTTTQHARLVLAPLFDHLVDRHIRDVRNVTESVLVDFIDVRLSALSPATREAYVAALKRFFAFLVRRRVLFFDPSRDIRLPRSEGLPRRILNEAQVRRLVEAPDRSTPLGLRDAAILEVLYGTGIRQGECGRLDVTDVDLSRGVLFVRTGKGRKDRIVPLAGRANATVDAYLEHGRPELHVKPGESAVFLSYAGRRLCRSALDVVVRTHGKHAGIKGHVSAHVLRHTCATHLIRNGADVRHVQRLLGHARLSTTAAYTRIVVIDLARMIERSHPREKRSRRRQPG